MTGTIPSRTTVDIGNGQASMANYADSHSVVRVSAKRFASSPWSQQYANDNAIFGLYAGRLYPLSLGADPIADYWHLRHKVALFDVPEKPIEIRGADAERFLNFLLTRDVRPTGAHPHGRGCHPMGRGPVLVRTRGRRLPRLDGGACNWVRRRGARSGRLGASGSRAA